MQRHSSSASLDSDDHPASAAVPFMCPRRPQSLQRGYSTGTELRSLHTLRHRTGSVSARYRMVLAGSSPPLSRLLLRALGNQRRFLRALSLRLLSAIAAAFLAHSTAIVGRSLLSRLLSCASSSADIAASSLRTLAARPYWRSPLYPLALSIARSSRQPTPLFSCIRSFRRCRSSCAFARFRRLSPLKSRLLLGRALRVGDRCRTPFALLLRL